MPNTSKTDWLTRLAVTETKMHVFHMFRVLYTSIAVLILGLELIAFHLGDLRLSQRPGY